MLDFVSVPSAALFCPHRWLTGKHLSERELDNMQQWKSDGLTPVQIHKRLSTDRRKTHRDGPDLTTVRRSLKGKTHQRSKVETRGRKRILTQTNLNRLDKTRDEIITKADNNYEVHWDDVIKRARVSKVHRTTVAKNIRDAGFDIAARKPRLKPCRTEADEAERKAKCNVLRKLDVTFYATKPDATIDNKKWKVPKSVRGRKHLNALKVRFHLRKKSEGLTKGYTKPHPVKHRTNTGGVVNLCAGIINNRVRVWHYLPKIWNGEEAAGLYTNVIHPALKRNRGNKRSYTILEDNDPTGYQSTQGKNAKAACKITTIDFPNLFARFESL